MQDRTGLRMRNKQCVGAGSDFGNAPIQNNRTKLKRNNKKYKYLLALNVFYAILNTLLLQMAFSLESGPSTATATAQLWTRPALFSGLSIGPDIRFEISNQFDFVGRKLTC